MAKDVDVHIKISRLRLNWSFKLTDLIPLVYLYKSDKNYDRDYMEKVGSFLYFLRPLTKKQATEVQSDIFTSILLLHSLFSGSQGNESGESKRKGLPIELIRLIISFACNPYVKDALSHVSGEYIPQICSWNNSLFNFTPRHLR